MARNEIRIILASGSPRRRELLGRFGLDFEVIPAVGEETAPPGLSPGALVEYLAEQKADRVYAGLGDAAALIIAADTVVELDGAILGKPGAPARAEEMLSALSGRTHRVWTGLCLRRGERRETAFECTSVRFRPLTESEAAAYAATGEPLDKAGAYAIQGLASAFVEGIDGDYFNVVGLPICRLGQMLKTFGVALF